ncbi:unnamed protein product [Protopolystoma xenopodis]|uniref:Uncharacterized protein n=1 Tax=Protopolystoma xenopodis TaxID=117903 RepID=A0A3S5AVU8_9PLAT|nr:unnamed protein product [Protopolystoma xenopodis]
MCNPTLVFLRAYVHALSIRGRAYDASRLDTIFCLACAHFTVHQSQLKLPAVHVHFLPAPAGRGLSTRCPMARQILQLFRLLQSRWDPMHASLSVAAESVSHRRLTEWFQRLNLPQGLNQRRGRLEWKVDDLGRALT